MDYISIGDWIQKYFEWSLGILLLTGICNLVIEYVLAPIDDFFRSNK